MLGNLQWCRVAGRVAVARQDRRPFKRLGQMWLDWTRSAEVIRKSDPDLAVELANRWLEPTKATNWAGRLALLNEIHDHLRDEIPEFDRFCDVFPRFIAALIDRLADPDIHSADQAHVFANSANPEHRQAAAAWFRSQRRADRH